MTLRRKLYLNFLLTLVTSISVSAQSLSGTQWSKDPQHTGQINVAGQSLNQMLVDIVYDPFVAQETAPDQGDGDLFVHYQTPLVDGDDMFMEFKSGTFTGITTWESQTWNQRRYHWENGQLVQKWNFQSDWKPVPFGGPTWEPVYHAVLVGNFVYDPGFGGTVYKLDRATGAVLARINPFGGSIDKNTFVAGPLSADNAGNVYYNAIKLSPADPWGKDVVNSWLVKIAPNGTASKVTYATLTPGAPAAGDPCKVGFSNAQLPWPPSPDAQPGTTPCGTQRPGINIAPAIAPDGTIYTASRAHLVTRYCYLVAVNPDLTPKWNASLRGRLLDGCNVLLPPNGAPGGCRVGATTGYDPGTNEPPPGRIFDDGTASPTVAPDGSVFFGVLTFYNYAQGHLFKFSASGAFQGSYPFGWDVTPAIYSHGATYSVVIKDNHYATGSYCGVEQYCPSDRTATTPNDPEAYYITQLNKNMNVEWRFQNTNTLSCSRDDLGLVTCQSDHPNGFEWCVNAFAIDANGVVYANSEDGNLFAINQGGTLRQKIFLKLALGAAYTPLTMDASGRYYTQNAGHLYVVGN